MSAIKQETIFNKQPIPVTIEGMKIILNQMEKCVCKIYGENGQKGSGFFCNIPFFDKKMPFLITNNHVLDESAIRNNKIIELTINNEVKKTIKIEKTRTRYTNKQLDATFLEIKSDIDDIYDFMELDEDINKANDILELEYRKKSIYVLHYPEGRLCVSYGLTDGISDFKVINHICNTNNCSSGSPLLSLTTYKIIGIHIGGKNKTNFGVFIKYAIEGFKKDNPKLWNIQSNYVENSIFPKTKNEMNNYYLQTDRSISSDMKNILNHPISEFENIINNNNNKLKNNFNEVKLQNLYSLNDNIYFNNALIVFNLLKTYYNYRRKFEIMLYKGQNGDSFIQNIFYVIDKKWLKNWEKYIGYTHIRNILNNDRELNDNDYNWVVDIYKKTSTENVIYPLNNKAIYYNGELNALSDFFIIDNKCYDLFKALYTKNNLLDAKIYPIQFFKEKLLMIIKRNQFLIIIKEKDLYFELLFFILNEGNGNAKRFILDSLKNNDIIKWLNKHNFDLFSNEEIDIKENNCELKIINKTIRKKNINNNQNII